MFIITRKLFVVGALSCLASLSHAAVALFDFSTETLEDRFNGYIGGWFGNNLDFGQWYGSAADASISGSNLIVGSTAPNDARTAVVLLDPAAFAVDGAGDYRLSFDLTGFTMSDSLPNTGGDVAFASIWSGSGYDLSGSSGNALFVSPGLGTITPQGTASASEIARGEYSAAANGLIVDFTYDGSSAIAIFLGALEQGGWPFPTASFANVEISVVPEPNMAALLLGVLVFAMGNRRIYQSRRRAWMARRVRGPRARAGRPGGSGRRVVRGGRWPRTREV